VSSEKDSEIIEVRVSRRVLWIGSDAYPLQNIARAQALKITPPRGTPIKDYLKAVAGWVILGIVVTIGLSAVRVHGSTFLDLVWLVALAVIVIRTLRLILALRKKREYYALVIETAGTPNTALVSPSADVVLDLVHKIMDAIDNPQAEFSQPVTNIHLGDKINQFGNQNVGKISR
jgi:hypothetical protein